MAMIYYGPLSPVSFPLHKYGLYYTYTLLGRSEIEMGMEIEIEIEIDRNFNDESCL